MITHEAPGAGENAHSKYGGSVIGRVIACPGSVALSDGLPNPESVWAKDGTFAHKVAEYCLREGYENADSFLHASLPFGFDGSGRIPGPEIVTGVNIFLAAVFAELALSPDAELYVEETFVLAIDAAEPDEVFGKNDVLVYHPSLGRLAGFDFKNGYRPVVVENNPQLLFYAAGALLSKPHWRVRDVELIVAQPNGQDVDATGGIKRWRVSPADVLDFVSVVENAVGAAKRFVPVFEEGGAAALQAAGALCPGAHCKYCPAAAVACPAKEAQLIAGLGLQDVVTALADVKPAMLPEPKAIDVERLSKIKEILGQLSEYADQIDAAIFEALRNGQGVPGFKLVDKQSRRKWIDADEQVAAWLMLVHGIDEMQVRPPKLVTITEAERLLKAAVGSSAFAAAKADLSLKYTVKDSSGLTIVPTTDKRPAVDAVATAIAGLAA